MPHKPANQKARRCSKSFPIERLLSWMCEELRPTLIRPREGGGAGWCKVDCVRTAKMTLAVLRSFAVPARHLPLSVMVANRPVGRYLAAHARGVDALTPGELAAVPGGRLVRMGRLSTDEAYSTDAGWRGHMVVAVADRYLLDLTIDSVNDPADDFVGLEPFWLDVGPGVLRGLADGAGEFTLRADSGVVATYRGDPENRGYVATSAWLAWNELHDSILRASRTRFGEYRRE